MAVDAKLTPDPYLYALNDPPLPFSIDKTMTGINIIVLTQEAEKALSDLAHSLTDMKPALKAIGESLVESTNIGLRIPEAWARDKLKIPEPEGDEAILAPQQTPQPTPVGKSTDGSNPSPLAALAGQSNPVFTPQQMAVEALADAGLRAAMPLIEPELIQSAIRAASSPEDLEERLAALARDSDPIRFRQLLERALFAADVLGYAHADGR